MPTTPYTIKTSANGTGMTFGVDATLTGVAIESLEVDIQAQIDETALDQQGLVAAWALGGKQGSASITGYLTGTAPTIGATMSLTVEGVSVEARVTNVKPMKGNRSFTKLSVTAKFYEGVGTTP